MYGRGLDWIWGRCDLCRCYDHLRSVGRGVPAVNLWLCIRCQHPQHFPNR